MKPFLPFSRHWSRDLIKISFSPITPQGCIFTLRHAGWFGISVKNTSICIFKYPNTQIKGFLKIPWRVIQYLCVFWWELGNQRQHKNYRHHHITACRTKPRFKQPKSLTFRVLCLEVPISISTYERSFEVNKPIKIIAMITLVGMDGGYRSIDRLLLDSLKFFQSRATREAVTVNFQH